MAGPSLRPRAAGAAGEAAVASLLLCALAARPALGQAVSSEAVVIGEHVPSVRPSAAWPADTAAASNAAWITGRQPMRLAEWPQTRLGTQDPVLHACWKRTVTHDVATGWPDVCLNLFHDPQRTSEVVCKATCWNDPRCAVWQWIQVEDSLNETQCWLGAGTDCTSRDAQPGFQMLVLAGQRLRHGDIFVVRNMTGPLVANLYNLGYAEVGDEDPVTAESHVEKCRNWCYSLISCEYWQYGPTGCWVDAPFLSTETYAIPDRVVQYPLTTGGLNSAFQLVRGEYLQHYCAPQPSTSMAPIYQTPQAAPVAEDNASGIGSSFGLALGAIIVVFVLAGVLAMLGLGKGTTPCQREESSEELEEDDREDRHESRRLLDDQDSHGTPAQAEPRHPPGPAAPHTGYSGAPARPTELPRYQGYQPNQGYDHSSQAYQPSHQPSNQPSYQPSYQPSGRPAQTVV